MASTLDLSIPTTSTSTTSTPYTIYNISIRQPLRIYTLQKRYSDFVTLHNTLTSQASKTPPPAPLPSKSWFKKTISSPELTESRRKDLETYIRAVLTSSDPRWRQTEAFLKFLNLPLNTNTNASSNAANGTPKAAATARTQQEVIDPTLWMDIHRDLQSQLSETRQCLRRRTEASTAQAQHEAAAEVKRNLVRAGTTITALEEELRRMADMSKTPERRDKEKDGVDYGTTLGEGEITRRRGLLAAAKKERDNLEVQLTAAGSRSSTSTEASAAPQAHAALLRGPASAASSSGRRVLGGGHKVEETERTRELDNTGVLQLQQQILAEQEEDVGDLTKSVQRMKAMGLQINEELTYQDGMLKILDQDVERNEDKIRVAKGRMGKIK